MSETLLIIEDICGCEADACFCESTTRFELESTSIAGDSGIFVSMDEDKNI